MASEPEAAADAAARLEAALERIARLAHAGASRSAAAAAERAAASGHTAPGHTASGHTASGHTASGHTASGHTASGHTPLAARLDRIIERLRGALDHGA